MKNPTGKQRRAAEDARVKFVDAPANPPIHVHVFGNRKQRRARGEKRPLAELIQERLKKDAQDPDPR